MSESQPSLAVPSHVQGAESSREGSETGSRGPTPLNVQQMWDSFGLHVPQIVTDEVQGGGNPNPLASRASSMMSLATEPDLQDIHLSLDGLDQVDFFSSSKEQLDEHHDELCKVFAELKNYSSAFPGSDLGTWAGLHDKAKGILNTLNAARHGPGLPSEGVDLDPNLPSNSESTADSLRDHVRKCISNIQSPIVESVTVRVCDEYNRVGINCIASKTKLKRSIKGLRSDLSIFNSDLESNKIKISALSERITSNEANISSNLEVHNTNVQTLTELLSEVHKQVSDLSERMVKLEGKRVNFTSLQEACPSNTTAVDVTASVTHPSSILDMDNPLLPSSCQVPFQFSSTQPCHSLSAPTVARTSCPQGNLLPTMIPSECTQLSSAFTSVPYLDPSLSSVINRTIPIMSYKVSAPPVWPPTSSLGTSLVSVSIPPQTFAATTAHLGSGSASDSSSYPRTLPVINSHVSQPSHSTTMHSLPSLHSHPSVVPDEPLIGILPGQVTNEPDSCGESIVSVARSSASDSDQRKLQRLTRKVKVCISLIKSITNKDISNSSKADTIKLASYDLKKLQSYKTDLKDYSKQLDLLSVDDCELLDSIDDALDCTIGWESLLNENQSKFYLHLSGEKSLLKGVDLEKFSGDIHGENIYRFLQIFSQLTESSCSPSDKATLLFNSYLSDEIRKEVEFCKHSFELMTEHLILSYGDVRLIADAKLKGIAMLKAPSGQGQSLIDYYKTVESLLLSCESLADSPDANSEEVYSTVYNSGFIKSIASYLPKEIIHKFVSCLEKEPIRPPPSGKRHFEILKQVLNSRRRELTSINNIKSIREFPSETKAPKQSKQHSSVSVNVNTGAKSKTTPQKGSKSDSKPTLNFQCPFHPKNSHEIGYCQTFFSGNNQGRFDLCKANLICFTCLSGECLKVSVTSCISDIPDVLVCPDCKKNARNRAFSVLTCPYSNHSRPQFQELKSALQSYLKVFNWKLLDNLKDQFNLVIFSGQISHKSSAKPKPSLSSPVDSNKAVPNFDTSTGTHSNNPSEIRYSTNDDALYIFQELKIDDRSCLCFYDTGASGNLVCGEFAEKSSFKVLDQKSQIIGCLSSQTISTGYGVYLAQLGPDEDGAYHQIQFQGIEKITSAYPRYDLTPIAIEVKASGLLPEDTPLPLAVGGKSVDILLGIKTPELVPKLLFHMPSGIGIYKTPFFDTNSSNIAFGGSHYAITSANKRFGSFSVNHLSVMLTHQAQAFYEAPWIDLGIHMDQKPLPKLFQASKLQGTILPATPIPGDDLICLNPNVLPSPLVLETSCSQPHDSSHQCHCFSDSSSNHEQEQGMSGYKAKVPLSKIRNFLDRDQDIVSYRCPQCEDCDKCKKSNRLQSSSLRDRSEQKLIEKSISIDYNLKQVTVSLPFLRDPVDFFLKHFKGNSNYGQALAVYKTQCRKKPEVKDGIRKAMQELIDLNFVCKLNDLPSDLLTQTKASPVFHYYLWRAVLKDSISTPVRLVVDPTSSLMNVIVAKGDSNLSSMIQLLLNARSSAVCFCTDIRKLYNTMHLNPEAYPFSLFLFDMSLDADIAPVVYLLLRAWYGNAATSSQAATMLRKLGIDHLSSHPLGALVLLERTYVDDILSGAKNKDILNEQIVELDHILESAGLSKKYLVISGEAPPDNASSDGLSVPLLGYSWYPLEDLLALNIKDSNAEPMLTRRFVTSKAAEIYDPCGSYEPYSASLKRALSELRQLDWDEIIPAENQRQWKAFLKELPLLTSLRFARTCVPTHAVIPYKIRLICCTDASQDCGGAAVYISYLQTSGLWSSTLYFAKSRLMRFSVPRNELCALALGLELTYASLLSVPDTVTTVLILTDSVVSLCWSQNQNARHKVFVQNRVLTINRYLNWISDRIVDESALIAHIPGAENVSDMLTKGHPTLSSLDLASYWQNGPSWMMEDLESMPLTFFSDIAILPDDLSNIKSEIHNGQFHQQSLDMEPTIFFYQDMGELGDMASFLLKPPSLLASSSGKGLPKAENDFLIDILHFGWSKSNCILSISIKFGVKLLHRTHLKTKNPTVQESLSKRCTICIISNQPNHSLEKTNSSTTSSMNSHMQELGPLNEQPVMLPFIIQRILSHYWNLQATKDCLKRLPQKELKTCIKDPDTGILFYNGRVRSDQHIYVQDYDKDLFKFFDKVNFHNPCLLPDNPIFYVYALHVHYEANPHCGVESTLREILQRFHVFNPRRILEKILKDCIKCRILSKKVLDHEMSQHGDIKFTIAPPFSHVMIDLAQPFHTKVRWKGRQTFKVPALVLVCIITGALSIQMCEDWSTASLIQAIERHSCRYGCPAVLYVDQGSQMLKLSDVEYSILDLSNQVSRKYSCSLVTAPPKSHSHQGKVERKILHIRNMLERLNDVSFIQSFLGWETTMARVSNKINSLPLCRPSARSVQNTEWDIITPNRLLLGFNNRRALSGPMILDSTLSGMLERSSEIEKCFFEQLVKQLHLLIPRSKWFSSDKLFVNDICLFFMNDSVMKSRMVIWHYGTVISIINTRVTLQYKINNVSKSIQRSKRQIVRIASEHELNTSQKAHFKTITKQEK